MVVFVINLKRSAERRAAISSQLHRLGLPFRIVEAVDGRLLTEEQLSAECDPEVYQSQRLSPNVIACTLSHRRIYQTMVDEQIPVALILEDDIKIKPELTQLLPELERHLPADEILLLYNTPAGGCQVTTHDQISLAAGYRLHYPLAINHLWGAAAYMLRLDVAARLVQANSPVRFASDWWGDLAAAGGLRSVRCVLPMLCEHQSSFPSDIRRGPRQPTVQRALDLIYRYRVFPFHQLLARKRQKMAEKKAACLALVDTPSPLSMNSR